MGGKRTEITSPNNQPNVHKILNAPEILSQILNTINGWENNLETWDENQLNHQLGNLLSTISLQNGWLWSGHPFTNHFVKCHEITGTTAATAFLELIINKHTQNITQGDYFLGYVLAYEFLNQDSDLTKRHISERASLELLREKLFKTNSHLIAEVESFKNGLKSWNADTQKG